VECTTYRIRGHLEAEQHMLGGGAYRTEEDVAAWQADDKDPVTRLARRLLDSGACDQAELDRIDADIRARVEGAVAFAEAGPPADPELAPQIMFGPSA
jgi:pyruvate dehydrogenase E1 component alpha subunit